ncbi:MAG TPA: NADH-quinone oxidoreductase subunit M [Sunxiuqinia sp.]|nr:NADH-quinone oxidoreductase subunit M [Sunxiuqinia sp.]
MILIALISILLVAGIVSWIVGIRYASMPRWLTLGALILDLILSLAYWAANSGQLNFSGSGNWLVETNLNWIPQLGVNFHLAMDGLSLLMIVTTFFIGALTVIATWNQKLERPGFFFFNLLLILTGLTGVFLAIDLFLFYFFWELMLIPMYFIISLWGGENRRPAAFKFFLFTQAGGLLLLLSFLGIYFMHGINTGIYTFDYNQLLKTLINPDLALWLGIAMSIGFLIKIPLVPFHTWLPDANAQAPVAGSIVLAGLMWNSGIYGIMRFLFPLLPVAAQTISPVALVLGVIAILYGAKLAFAQTNLKRLVAYSSISHIGFVIIGLFVYDGIALQGVVMQMITHTISTAALLIMAGELFERLQIHDITDMGGIWSDAPRLGSYGLIFTMATVGLPGLGNFIAEFLVLLGSFKSATTITVLASIGMIASSIYALRMLQKIAYGKKQYQSNIKDLSLREKFVTALLVIPIVWLGLFPQPIFDSAQQSIEKILNPTIEMQTGATSKANQKMMKPDNFSSRQKNAEMGILTNDTKGVKR